MALVSGTIGGGLICFVAHIHGRKVAYPSMFIPLDPVIISFLGGVDSFVHACLFIAMQVVLYDMRCCIMAYVH